MEPLLSIQLFDHTPCYLPGDVLKCDYQIDAVGDREVQAVETSVLWYTEGKGDEDMGVHFFQRRVVDDEPTELARVEASRSAAAVQSAQLRRCVAKSLLVRATASLHAGRQRIDFGPSLHPGKARGG